jgi:hypothetical protein
MSFRLLNVLLALPLFLAISCSDSGNKVKPGTGELVTVSGIVATLDNLSPAADACVFLLDNDQYISEPTNANGEYSIQVPAGSPFLLTVDDCTDRMQNNKGKYYPTINADTVFLATIDEAKEGWPLHVGTNISLVADGANATWENYFDNATISPDIFDPIASVYDPNLAGFIFLGTFFINTNDTLPNYPFEAFQIGQTFSAGDSNCPVGYINNPTTFDANGFPKPSLGPNVFQENGTVTDISGNALSFCKSGAADTLTLTLTSPGRTPEVAEYADIPIRPFTCTVVFPASIDGTVVHIGDVFALFAG